MFDATGAFAESAPRAELFTYASRSATRCSRDGDADGNDVCAYSGDENAMTAVSKKTRIITRFRYSAWSVHSKKNGYGASLHCSQLMAARPGGMRCSLLG